MTRDHEVWAEALLLERQHGDAAPQMIAERIRTLARDGDESGVARWLAIADRYDSLQPDDRPAH